MVHSVLFLSPAPSDGTMTWHIQRTTRWNVSKSESLWTWPTTISVVFDFDRGLFSSFVYLQGKMILLLRANQHQQVRSTAMFGSLLSYSHVLDAIWDRHSWLLFLSFSKYIYKYRLFYWMFDVECNSNGCTFE